jgi:hypothetical protein
VHEVIRAAETALHWAEYERWSHSTTTTRKETMTTTDTTDDGYHATIIANLTTEDTALFIKMDTNGRIVLVAFDLEEIQDKAGLADDPIDPIAVVTLTPHGATTLAGMLTHAVQHLAGMWEDDQDTPQP